MADVLPGRNSAKEDRDRNLPLPCISGGKAETPTDVMERFYMEQTCDDTFTTDLESFLHGISTDTLDIHGCADELLCTVHPPQTFVAVPSCHAS